MIEHNQLEQIWTKALKSLKETIPASGFHAWVKPAKLSALVGSQATLQVRNQFSANILEQNYLKQIRDVLAQITAQNELAINVELGALIGPIDYQQQPNLSIVEESEPAPRRKNGPELSLNPRYTFESFVVGPHNQFSHAAAISLATSSAEGDYNPLFIWGSSGLGKTHLMQAIAHFARASSKQAQIIYVTAEQFLNDLIDSMRQGKMKDFRHRYRRSDFLLIDDIQFIEGKESTQEEFFHTFNALKEAGSRVVLTSDRPPSCIKKLEPRLCSRFEGGLVTDIQAPSYEIRRAILDLKAQGMRLRLVPEVADAICEAFPANIRQLEGALLKVQAYQNFSNKTFTLEEVREILRVDAMAESVSKSVLPREKILLTEAPSEQLGRLVEAICLHLPLKPEDLSSSANSDDLRRARQALVFLGRVSGITFKELARALKRSASTLVQVHKLAQLAQLEDESFQGLLSKIQAESVKSQAPKVEPLA